MDAGWARLHRVPRGRVQSPDPGLDRVNVKDGPTGVMAALSH